MLLKVSCPASRSLYNLVIGLLVFILFLFLDLRVVGLRICHPYVQVVTCFDSVLSGLE